MDFVTWVEDVLLVEKFEEDVMRSPRTGRIRQQRCQIDVVTLQIELNEISILEDQWDSDL